MPNPSPQPKSPKTERTLAEAHLDIGLGNTYRIEYIKHLMSISVGVFVFSVTFMKDIIGAPSANAELKVALIVGWAALAISTVAGIFHMKLWALFYISWGLHYQEESAKRWRWQLTRWRKVSEFVQISGFIVGMLAMIVFAIRNLKF